MFDSLRELDAAATLAAGEANEDVLVEAETRRLMIAAHWADLHAGDAVDPEGLPGRERAVQPGGDGTPEVAEFCFAELGTSLRMTAGSASRLIADALDLRHRLPDTWAAARAGRMPTYQARRVATVTRRLTRDQARLVDGRIAPALGAVSFGRLQSLLEGFVYDADPEAAEQAADQAARERFVRLGRSSEHGLRTIWAKVSAGDALWGNAVITRVAEILKRDGDPDCLDVRRSKAFGLLLSQPAEALRLLHSHRDDPDEPDRCPEPVEGSEDDGTNADATDSDLAPRQAQGTNPDDGANADAADSGLAPRQAQGTNPDDCAGSVDGAGAAEGAGAGSRSLRIVPPPFDPAKARPRAVVYIHVSEEALFAGRGVARVEDVGPVLVTRLRQLIGDRCQLLLKPVIDLNDTPAPVDSYEVPDGLREHLHLRQPVDVFPYAGGGSRRTDLDHTIAYVPLEKGGPPGQTAVEELGPLVRYHHRVRTHGNWQIRQPEPGSYLWRSPHGRIFLVNASGTHPLGRKRFARQIWRAAKAPPERNQQLDQDTRSEEPSSESRLERALRGFLDAQTLARSVSPESA